MSERIVITGIGAISPIGLSAEESWNNALNSTSGVGPITLFDISNYLVKIAAEVKNFVPEQYMDTKDVRRRDRYQHFAVAAAREAILQAGLEFSETRKVNSERIGVVVSSAIGGLTVLHESINILRDEGSLSIRTVHYSNADAKWSCWFDKY